MWALNKHSSKNNGFTIVELLIVIVVIGILAAIVIVAFNGVQDRAKWSKAQSDLNSINKAIQLYYAENGAYPATATPPNWSWRYSCATGVGSGGSAFIPGIDSVVDSLPQAPCSVTGTNNDTWIYGSDGLEYKLLHIRPNFSDSIKNGIPANLRDPYGGRWSSSGTVIGTWGYWSETAATTR